MGRFIANYQSYVSPTVLLAESVCTGACTIGFLNSLGSLLDESGPANFDQGLSQREKPQGNPDPNDLWWAIGFRVHGRSMLAGQWAAGALTQLLTTYRKPLVRAVEFF
jgi:hypothetical protein